MEASVTKPFDEGIRYERDLFLQLIQSPESRALRHAFFGERAASKIPDVPADTALRKVESVAVIGAGTMGGGITMNFLTAGIPVTLLETRQEALDKGVATIRRNYESTVKKGKLTQDKLDKAMSLLKPTLSYADLKGADLVIEAVFEEMGVKEAVFRPLTSRCRPMPNRPSMMRSHCPFAGIRSSVPPPLSRQAARAACVCADSPAALPVNTTSTLNHHALR